MSMDDTSFGPFGYDRSATDDDPHPTDKHIRRVITRDMNLLAILHFAFAATPRPCAL